VLWSLDEICRIVKDHRPATKLAHIQETDILRASGPLHGHKQVPVNIDIIELDALCQYRDRLKAG